MKRKIILTLFLFLISTLSVVESDAADSISAKFLEIPYTPNQDDFRYAGDAPFSIEFVGGESLKASSCFNLTSEIARDFSVKWSIGDKSLSQSLDKGGGYVHTIGVTKNGIQCAYLFQGGGLYDSNPLREPIYTFSKNESKVKLKLTLFRGSSEITSEYGFLLNPEFEPSAPEIVGISRGDIVNNYTKFSLKYLDGNSSKLEKPTISLCELGTSNCQLGWTRLQDDGSYILLTSKNAIGKSASLNVEFYSRNSAGYNVYPTSSVILKIGSSSELVPWDVTKQFKDDLRINPYLECAKWATGGKQLECSVKPRVTTQGLDFEEESIVNTKVYFRTYIQLNTKSWTESKAFWAETDIPTKFSIAVPAGRWNRFQLRIDNNFLPQIKDTDIETYGKLPAGPQVVLNFPNFVLWNQPFQIKASSTKGTLTSCDFSMGNTKLGKVKAIGGVAKIFVTSVWNGSPGSSTNLYYRASCLISGKTVVGIGYVNGFR